jgi:hypothetical protein
MHVPPNSVASAEPNLQLVKKDAFINKSVVTKVSPGGVGLSDSIEKLVFADYSCPAPNAINKVNVPMQGILKKAIEFISLFGLVGIVCLLVTLSSPLVRAQDIKGKAYLPRLADMMNDAMQIHHIKLWIAGRANNWTLAAYEAKKIKETIEEIKETIIDIQALLPQWRHVTLGEMLTKFDSSLMALDEAVKVKDAGRFETSYRELTATCNACHVSAGQSQVKIIVPVLNGSGSFSDQDFATESNQQ